MRKTTIIMDEDLLERVSEILGTRGIKGTIDAALREVVAMDARRKVIKQLRAMDGLDLNRPEVMENAWR